MRGMPSTCGARLLVIALAGLLASWGCADFDKAQQEYCQSHPSHCTTPDTETLFLSDICSPDFKGFGPVRCSVVSNGFGPVESDHSNGGDMGGDGRTLTLNNVAYPKGLGVHAPSEVDFNLGNSCSIFTADIGVDDEVDSRGSVVFQVWGDDTLLFESGTMTGLTPTLGVNVDLSGRSTLRLIVTDAKDGKSNDHSDWANARITCDMN